MKKAVYSFPMKALAVLLLTLDSLFTGFYGAVALIAWDARFYEVPAGVGGYTEAMRYLLDGGWLSEYGYNTLTSGRERELSEFVFSNRYAAIALAAVGLLLFLVLFVYLMAAAGRRGDREGIVLSPLDKVPFDVTLGAGAMAVVMFGLIIAESGGDDLFVVGVVIAGAVLILLTVVYVLYTFSARIKAGGWWRNTVVFKLLRLIGRCFKAIGRFFLRLFRALRMEWRVALGFAGYFLADFVGVLIFLEGMDSDVELLGLALLCAVNLAAFSVLILGAHQFAVLKKAGAKLASGELDYKVDTKKMYFDYRRHAENLNSIGDGMSAAVDQRMRSERLKTELITNVSHDIKTPLTSIVNYVDLLQKPHSEEEGRQYLDVLARQSDKLRHLTLDLVEASKASTGNLPTELVPTNTAELISQAVAEYAERFAQSGLEPVVTVPDKPVTVLADGRHLWRVLDNLLGNAVKYAQPGTRVYIDVRRLDGQGLLSVKNISRDRLNVPADELMERFVRGDRSRHTEGSGLGLSIALSLTELMGGAFNITIDGDLFKAEVSLKEVRP